uniref:hypothetical protein n=1 Tax=Gracilariopsis tenuifrons TaxID=31472 RepID=UPI001D126416|nr:hypothetical protein LK036_mgp01 [Gracilariopsis tenuifrons]UAD89967.1 hypothetical protein [Gracilariopsis tenuifrons]
MRLKYQYNFIDKLDSLETNLFAKKKSILFVQKTIKIYSNLEKSIKATLGSKFFLEVLSGQKSFNGGNKTQKNVSPLFFNVTVRGNKTFILFESLLHTTFFLHISMFNLDRWNITNLDFFMDSEFLNKLSLLQILASSKVTIF